MELTKKDLVLDTEEKIIRTVWDINQFLANCTAVWQCFGQIKEYHIELYHHSIKVAFLSLLIRGETPVTEKDLIGYGKKE